MTGEGDARTVSLTGHVLDPAGPMLRDHVRPPARRTEQYLARYDRTTLHYDCVYLPERAAYLFTAPRFLNFWRPFRDGLRVGGRPVRRLRRRRWLRCEQVEVPAPRGTLTLDLGGGPVPAATRETIAERFAGRNCIVAVNKDNRLDWIADWARVHAAAHGATGAVIFDNGSTAYTARDVVDVLAAVPGIAAAVVYDAPFPYGPADRGGRFDISPRFFQTAMLNLARRDALARARAVLSLDIDEIAVSRSGASVFDAAVRHPLGLVSIPGSWVFPAPDTAGPAGQRAHVFRAVPDEATNPKWCVRPGGVMDRMGWAVHRLDEVIHPLATRQRDVRLIHCRAASTGWKGGRFQWPARLECDSDLGAFLDRTLGP